MLFARPDRNDVAGALVVDLIERPIERRNELAGRGRLERDFMLGTLGNDENEAVPNFDLGRDRPEITLSHAYTPDSLTRRTAHDSFVINLKQTNGKTGLGSSQRLAA